MFYIIAAIIISFLCGALPTAFLVAMFSAKIDIRQHGSGNVGATNAFRVLGKKYGFMVLVIDFLKGYLPILFFMHSTNARIYENVPWFGLAAVLGHIFTPFLGFKGGKGIATGAGVICAIKPMLFIGTLSVWIIVFMITHIVSLSSIIAASSMILLAFLTDPHWHVRFFFILIFIVSIWTHRSNIIRIIKGVENRLF